LKNGLCYSATVFGTNCHKRSTMQHN